jgi:hypothetical protein
MKQLLIIALLFPTILWGQSATFYADSTSLWQDVGRKKQLLDRVMEMEWKINGHVLRFGSKPLGVNADPNTIDTLFYRQNSKAKWDTIICNIKEAVTYKFTYNTCCDGFNVSGSNGKFIKAKVHFRLIGKAKHKTFLGTLGEAGILVDVSTTDTLLPGCRSAMSPNIYSLSFKEVQVCTDSSRCKEDICLFEKDKEEMNYEFKFRTISSKLHILFMPLSGDPIQITYNADSDKITIR